MLLKILFQLIALGTLVFAIPTSVLEDLKDVQLQSPIRANKVKRAQEFIMFGNQQNRVTSTNYPNTRSDKQVTEIGDNNLAEVESSIPQIMPQSDSSSYENNHLTNGKIYEKSYPYISRDLYYNMLLRNLELTQNLHNDPALNFDFPTYSVMDGRNKRDTKTTLAKHKPLLKRENIKENALSPEDVLALMRMIENNKDKYYTDRNAVGWPVYETDNEDFPGVDEDSSYETELPEETGGWHNNRGGAIYPSSSSSNYNHLLDSLRTSRAHKRFMISKRRMNGDGVAQYMPYGSYDPSDGIPLHRRFLL